MMVHFENNPDPIMRGYQEIFRGTDSALVAAGPLFNIIRGLLFGLVLYPFRDIFSKRKYGWVYLWALFLVLAQFSTIGAGPGSIEGLIYTHIPLSIHLITPWEGVLQTLLFSLLLIRWEKGINKKLLMILYLFSIMLLAGIVMGVIQAI